MPFTFDCRQCGQPIQAGEEMAGRRGRCPHCYAAFTIPEPQAAFSSSPSPAPADEREDHPLALPQGRADDEESPPFDDRDWQPAKLQRRDRARRSEAALFRRPERGWNTVRTGLTLMRVGLIISVLIILALGLLAILTLVLRDDMGRDRQTEAMLGILAGLGALAGLVALVLFVVGQCMCCAAPEESGTKGLAIGSTICLFVSLGLILAGLFFSAVASEQRGAREGFAVIAAGFLLLAGILGIANHILFVLFLRSSARYFRNEQLAASAGTYQVLFVIFIVFYLLALGLAVVMRADVRAGPAAGIFLVIIGIGLLVFGLVLFLYLLDLLNRAGTMIGHAADESW